MKRLIFTLSWLAAGGIFLPVFGQRATDSTLQEATLQNVIQYALKNQAKVQQALVDENITNETIKSKLADWYPQVNFNYTVQHNFQLQTAVFEGVPRTLGVANTSAAQFLLTQNIFNRDVLLAARTKGDVQLQARQNTANNKIAVTVNVSKAYYDLLSTIEQIKVNKQNIVRQESSLKNAQAQYEAGTTDKTDYKRATITLNNTKATLASNLALLNAKKEYLKFMMGYPVSQDLNIVYDSLQMERETAMDTLQLPFVNNRIEYQQLQTQRKLQQANVKYERWSFLPTLSLNGAYAGNYLNGNLGKLYNDNFPTSYAGLALGIPIFQGGKRTAKIHIAEWQLKRTEWDIMNLENQVSSEYRQAMAIYRGALANYLALKENMQLAQEVYDVIQLQYESGIKAYIEVINSETDLRTAQINYYNALYQVLASKVDVQRTLGQITY